MGREEKWVFLREMMFDKTEIVAVEVLMDGLGCSDSRMGPAEGGAGSRSKTRLGVSGIRMNTLNGG